MTQETKASSWMMVYSILNLTAYHEGKSAGASRQEPGGRKGRRGHGGVLPCCLLLHMQAVRELQDVGCGEGWSPTEQEESCSGGEEHPFLWPATWLQASTDNSCVGQEQLWETVHPKDG